MENKTTTAHYLKDSESVTGWTSVSAEFYNARLEGGKHEVAKVERSEEGKISVSVNNGRAKDFYIERSDEDLIAMALT